MFQSSSKFVHIWMRLLFASVGHVTPYPIDIFWLISGTSFMGYHIRKKTINTFLPWNGPPSLGYPYIKKMAMKPLGGGDFESATPPANKQQTTSMADVTPVWRLFDSNVRIVEWFSWLIIKTVLDRYRQVVTTNTCVFFPNRFNLLITNLQQIKKIEHY